jgi:hypothetical protein
MPEPMKRQVYLEGVHTEVRSGKLTGFRAVLYYDCTQAEIHILTAEPRSVTAGIPETVRLELRSLIEALEVAAESSSHISQGQAPRR